MDFSYSPRTVDLQGRLLAFIAEHVVPAEPRYFAEIEANTAAGKRWTPLQLIEDLKVEARATGAGARPLAELAWQFAQKA